MRRKILRRLGGVLLAWVVIVALHFPWGVDGPHAPTELIDDADQFYEAAYEVDAEQEEGDSRYVRIANLTAHHADVESRLAAFVNTKELASARALEVGAGSGTLQDVVEDYTGLDIASSAGRFFHKPFVHGSATDLPFPDASFDLVFSIWTYEHVPNPGRAFEEARRVVGDGGWLYLEPAWNNHTWAPHGWPVRPDDTLGPVEIVRKYSLLIREISWFKGAYQLPTRAVRTLAAATGETRLRFREVDGNFEDYWIPDSDAVNSIDCYEAALWFKTRGDEVTLNGEPVGMFTPCNGEPLLVQVSK